MHYKDTFTDIKTARSLLITEEMRLKSNELALPVDSSLSSPMVLVADSGNSRRSSTHQGKSWRPCFNFVKGSCRFGDNYRYVHDLNAKIGGTSGSQKMCTNTTDEILTKLLAKLDLNSTCNNTVFPAMSNPVALHATPSPTCPSYSSPQAHMSSLYPPPGFGLSLVQQVHNRSTTSQTVTPTGHSGQETTLPHAFTVGTLHDPTTGAWNMDTGAMSNY
ncbi:ribonuclease H-like domain-containing protein [Tanacetum coccineum]